MELSQNDKNILDLCAKEFNAGRADGVKMQCLNKEEAELMKEYMARRHPDVLFYVSWLEFGKWNDS